ncbi:MAG: SDR family NAD(P)-dependent oxidoreductase [Bacteroidales bacterium]|nr:SDR family NAD(P)-dependent oxidoreductase [Bacteroidales bacterium]
MQTTNNTILITGGSSGIGLALVKKFYGLDNKIIITARNIHKLNEVKEKYPAVEIFQCDLTKPDDLDACIAFIKQKYPTINVLINNAGVQYNYNFKSEPDLTQKIDYEITTNFTSTVKLCAMLLPVMIKNENPAIVTISSGLALSPKKSAPVYCATKAAIHNFTKAFRYQMEETPLKVFEIMPPLVDTAMTEGRGTGKISPEALVEEFFKNFKNDKFESYIGKTKLLRFLKRLAPNFADGLLKNGL